jgi:hypothetical protein
MQTYPKQLPTTQIRALRSEPRPIPQQFLIALVRPGSSIWELDALVRPKVLPGLGRRMECSSYDINYGLADVCGWRTGPCYGESLGIVGITMVAGWKHDDEMELEKA